MLRTTLESHRHLASTVRRPARPPILPGLLLSDDVNTGGAWLDAHRAGDLGSDPLVLTDRRKAIGCARPPR